MLLAQEVAHGIIADWLLPCQSPGQLTVTFHLRIGQPFEEYRIDAVRVSEVFRIPKTGIAVRKQPSSSPFSLWRFAELGCWQCFSDSAIVSVPCRAKAASSANLCGFRRSDRRFRCERSEL